MKTPTAASEIRTTTHQAGDLEGSSRLIPRLLNAVVGSMPWTSGAEVNIPHAIPHAFDHPPPAWPPVITLGPPGRYPFTDYNTRLPPVVFQRMERFCGRRRSIRSGGRWFPLDPATKVHNSRRPAPPSRNAPMSRQRRSTSTIGRAASVLPHCDIGTSHSGLAMGTVSMDTRISIDMFHPWSGTLRYDAFLDHALRKEASDNARTDGAIADHRSPIATRG